MRLARDLMGHTRVYRLLSGFRDRPSADLDAIALILVKVSQLAADCAEVVELDINPLLADERGVISLDARIKVASAEASAEARLAVRPYPQELEEEVPLSNGRTLLLRPIRPEDEPALVEGFKKLSPEAVRLRFFSRIKELSHETAARFTQIDYDREMALVLAAKGIPGKAELYGVVRIAADPDIERPEYAITVRDDMTGMGLGMLLMQRIIAYARRRRIKQLFGHVLPENHRMLGICDKLGFRIVPEPDDHDVVSVTLDM